MCIYNINKIISELKTETKINKDKDKIPVYKIFNTITGDETKISLNTNNSFHYVYNDNFTGVNCDIYVNQKTLIALLVHVDVMKSFFKIEMEEK